MPSALTAERFDETVGARKRERPTWILDAIGALIGVGADTVRALAKEPGSPIHRRAGRWYCYESELLAWMRQPAA